MINDQKVLIVDDEMKIVEVIKSYLENQGYEVYGAYNGRQALEVFEGTNPSLVILDLMLPDISGEEICKTLRKRTEVPIIILSAKVEVDTMLKSLNIGATDYMAKPFSTRQLVAKVKSLLTKEEYHTLASSELLNNNEEQSA